MKKKLWSGLSQELKEEINDLKVNSKELVLIGVDLEGQIGFTEYMFKNKVFGENVVKQVKFIVETSDITSIRQCKNHLPE